MQHCIGTTTIASKCVLNIIHNICIIKLLSDYIIRVFVYVCWKSGSAIFRSSNISGSNLTDQSMIVNVIWQVQASINLMVDFVHISIRYGSNWHYYQR